MCSSHPRLPRGLQTPQTVPPSPGGAGPVSHPLAPPPSSHSPGVGVGRVEGEQVEWMVTEVHTFNIYTLNISHTHTHTRAGVWLQNNRLPQQYVFLCLAEQTSAVKLGFLILLLSPMLLRYAASNRHRICSDTFSNEEQQMNLFNSI